MVEYTSTIIQGVTHIYFQYGDEEAVRRCETDKSAKIENLNEVKEDDLRQMIKSGVVCPQCTRYKTGIIVEQ